MLNRHATELVTEALQWSPVVLVEGARQVGKSVLVRDLVGETRAAEYVTLDDALRLSSARRNPQEFVFELADPVTLDECQRAPEVFRPIKLSVDQDRRPGRFLLTGSANVMLLPQLSDSLAGRMRVITLWPLSQGEINEQREQFLEGIFSTPLRPALSTLGICDRENYAHRITRGGFPEVLSLPEGRARDGWMSSYISAILEREVRDISGVSDRIGLPRLLSILASRSGTLLNASDLSRAVGIPRTTTDRYLSLYIKTYQLLLVPPWSGDIARRLVRSPKVLLCDSGLCAHLAHCDTARLLSDPNQFGPLLETFVGIELIRQLSASQQPYELMHYRDSAGTEVDWVLEDSAGRLVGIEVKSTISPTEHDFKGLRSFAKAVGSRFHCGLVLHTGTTVAPMGDNLWAMPVDALWQLQPSTERGRV